MIFNNNKYETLVFRPLARTFSVFNSGSAVTSKSGSQTKMLVSYVRLWLFLQFKNIVAKISKKSDIKQRVRKFTFKTFKKWPFKEDFYAETDEQRYIVPLVCKVCSDSLEGMKVG